MERGGAVVIAGDHAPFGWLLDIPADGQDAVIQGGADGVQGLGAQLAALFLAQGYEVTYLMAWRTVLGRMVPQSNTLVAEGQSSS